MPTGCVIEVSGLRKSYGPVSAVDGLDLSMEGGEVLALLGPNGAGKTTTVEILEGYRRRDAGRVAVLGEDPQKAGARWRARRGIVLQSVDDMGDLTVGECVRHFSVLCPDPADPVEVVERVGLAAKRRARIRTLSGGQRRRLDVALGIVGRPELLFLDEPTTGFDPEARRAFWELVRSLAAEGTSILLTTHYLDEAEALADRVAVVHRGRVVASGPPADLAGRGSAPARVSHNSEIVLLRAAQEALSNAGRHATARSVQVTLTFADQDVLLVVRDDGVGFAPAQAQGFGLTQMQERAVQVGGRAEVKSTPGRGSEVRVSVPHLGLSPGCAPEPAVNNGEPRGEAVRQ